IAGTMYCSSPRWQDTSVRAANDEVRGMGSRANDWREDKAIMRRLLGLNDKNAPRSGALIG
ncbi:hypothetical protein Tco_1100438, partial [Tanacetum coccineum]